MLGVWLGGSVTVSAQPLASVGGRVVDQTGQPLPDVTIELTGEGRPSRTTRSGPDGSYALAGLSPGPATVSFRRIDFIDVRQGVELAPAGAVELDITLYLSLTADLTVTGTRTFRHLAELEVAPDHLVGLASSASEGLVTAGQIERRPMHRVGEVLETVPGLVISQHSGDGKSNQMYLRGFNLDHGTDFATTVAGAPVNLPTHGHGQGYTDVNFLIPELVAAVQFRKGPYSVESGDFSAAGSARIRYVNELASPIAVVGLGEDGWGRVLAAASPGLGAGRLLAAVELGRHDGPWVRPDDARRINGVLRYSRGTSRHGFSVTGLGYTADWRATDQIPRRAVEAGLIDRFEGLDDTLGGETSRYLVSADAHRARSGAVTRVTGYLQRYRLTLRSNATYQLEDPVRGDQFEQEDRRWVTGGRIVHRWLSTWGGRSVETAVGADLRHDAVGVVGLYRTRRGIRLSVTRRDRVDQTTGGVFGQTEIEWTPWVRTTVGLRGDGFRFGVVSDDARNSGRARAGAVSPRGSLVLGPWRGTEVYANGGLGFHSNDARGTTITVDPATGAPAERVTPLAGARGAEIGVRTVGLPGVQSTITVWTLGLESELLFVGDAGGTEASRPSRRHGVEWSALAQIVPWLTVDADVALTRARFTDGHAAGVHIPGAPSRVVSMGLTAGGDRQRLFGSLRWRHVGPRPLTEDDRVRSASTDLVYLQAGVRLSDRVRLTVDVFNLFDVTASDVEYFYRSRLPGEPLAGVEDVHFHPATPRTIRVGLRLGS